MKRFFYFLTAVYIIFGLILSPALAQSETPTPAPTPTPGSSEVSDIPLVHIVQDGETLISIAEQYGTTVEILQQLNNISDPSLVFAGQELIVPGGGGTAVAVSYTIQLGDSLEELAANYNTTISAIAGANALVNPNHLVVGQSLTILSRTGSADPQPLTGTAHIVEAGDSLLTIAARYNQFPPAIVAANNLSTPTYLFPGQRLRIPGEGNYQFLPGNWGRVQIHPLPITQGRTLAVYVEHLLPGTPTGEFVGQSLHFSPYGSGSEAGDLEAGGYVALVGLDAFTEPGYYTLILGGSGDQPWRPFRQTVRVGSAGFGTELIAIPEEQNHLLAPEVRDEEDAFLATIFGQFTDTQLWEGLFQLPVTNTIVTSSYGNARSYNGGPFDIFHTGIDFSGIVGTPIYAPANGRVVFSDTTNLRGNVLIVDHGLGVMTGFYHLSRILVPVGELVTAGQVIAEGGSTGLSSGPHLHWDLRVLDVPVNPLQWTEEMFP